MHQVYVVTHGDKHSGANPGMTTKGFEQVATLRDLLPACAIPIPVVCGTGRRHLDVAIALNLTPDRYTGAVGSADSMDIIAGKKTIILPDGTTMDPALYTTLEDMAPAAIALIASFQCDAIICAGRPSMIMLGVTDAKSAAVYCITTDEGRIVSITEVVATGVSEVGTV